MGFLIFLPFLGTVMVIWILFLIVYAIVKFILYVFKSFGLLRIAKNEGYKYPYIVWIPLISNYVLAKYCMDKKKSIIYLSLSIIKLLLMIIYFIMTKIDIINYILMIYSIFYFIVDMIVMNKFYKKVYKMPELFTILSVITFGLLNSVFIYTARIKKITKVNLN